MAAHLSCVIESNVATPGQGLALSLARPLDPGFDGGQAKAVGIGVVLQPHALEIAALEEVPVALRQLGRYLPHALRQRVDRGAITGSSSARSSGSGTLAFAKRR